MGVQESNKSDRTGERGPCRCFFTQHSVCSSAIGLTLIFCIISCNHWTLRSSWLKIFSVLPDESSPVSQQGSSLSSSFVLRRSLFFHEQGYSQYEEDQEYDRRHLQDSAALVNKEKRLEYLEMKRKNYQDKSMRAKKQNKDGRARGRSGPVQGPMQSGSFSGRPPMSGLRGPGSKPRFGSGMGYGPSPYMQQRQRGPPPSAQYGYGPPQGNRGGPGGKIPPSAQSGYGPPWGNRGGPGGKMNRKGPSDFWADNNGDTESFNGRPKRKRADWRQKMGNKRGPGQRYNVQPEDFNAGWNLFRVQTPRQRVKSKEGGGGGRPLPNYKNTRFTMCKIAFGAYTKNPAEMPFFKDLITASGCNSPENRWELSWDDAEIFLKDVRVVPPTGFIHHEARVGSTLVANILAADPENMVYSESQPMTEASMALKDNPVEDRIKVLQMTAALMGVSDFHQGLWYKMTPISITEVELFKLAFPDTPYIYLHREPVEVMMSLLRKKKPESSNKIYGNRQTYIDFNQPKGGPGGMPGGPGGMPGPRGMGGPQRPDPNMLPTCLRPQLKDRVNPMLDLDEAGEKWVPAEQYCAASLYLICKDAADGIHGDMNGLPVSYSEDLADRFINKILPHHFKAALSPEKKARALEVSETYSKARRKSGKDFKDDTNAKQAKAWDEVKHHADRYVRDIYEKLVLVEEQRVKQWGKFAI